MCNKISQLRNLVWRA